MEIIKLLENKLNASFNGATGDDLKDFILANSKSLIKDIDVMNEIYLNLRYGNKDLLFIELDTKHVMKLEGKLKPENIIELRSAYQSYSSFMDVNLSRSQRVVVELSMKAQPIYNTLIKLIEFLKDFSKEFNTDLTLSVDETDDVTNPWAIRIFYGKLLKQRFKIELNDNYAFLNSYFELASRCASDNISDFVNKLIYEVEFVNTLKLSRILD